MNIPEQIILPAQPIINKQQNITTQINKPPGLARDQTQPINNNIAAIHNQIVAKNTKKLSLIDQISLFIPFPPQKIVAVGLTIQSIWGIYQSIKFIVVDYPLLEQQLKFHLIDQSQINTFANKAVLIIVSTIISMIFALKIATVQTKVAQRLNTAVGLFLIFGNAAIYNYLDKIGSSAWLTNLVTNTINSLIQLF